MDQLTEIVKRTIKYIIEGFAVALAAYYIPQRMMQLDEIVTIGLTAAATFAVLDVLAPSIASSARMGAGFGVGANLTGFMRP
jgi:hypothetical protein